MLLLKRDAHFPDDNLTHERSFVVTLFQNKETVIDVTDEDLLIIRLNI